MQNQNKIRPTFNQKKRPHTQGGNFPSSSMYTSTKQPCPTAITSNPVMSQPMCRGPAWNSDRSVNNNQGPSTSSGYHGNPFPSTPGYCNTSSSGSYHESPSSAAESVNSRWQQRAGASNRPATNRMMTMPLTSGATSFTNQQPTSSSQWQRANQGQPRQQWSSSTYARPPQMPKVASQQHAMIRPNIQNSGRKKQDGFMVDDRSLKVFTSSISEVKNWTKHPDPRTGPILLEVFGQLSSSVSSTVTGIDKTFILTDEGHTLKCIFYETDRTLPTFTIDQWLRCVGSLDQRSGQFRCVSVRPATETEHTVMKTLTMYSREAMKNTLASVQEP